MLELTHNPLYTVLLKRFSQGKLSRRVIPSFSKAFNINEEEIEKHVSQFESLSDFFSRKLKEGSREISESARDIVSPVDGVLTEAGKITKDKSFFVKGHRHSLKTMLGLDTSVKRFAEGDYCVLYLSPKDYHRIHSPCKGKITGRWALGKYSHPVNALGFRFGKEPLATNYRLITELKHDEKHVALVKVGALNVNSVHPVHVEESIDKGDDMAYFSFGSTVVLVFERNSVRFHERVLQGELTVKQGETIGTWME